ncbi:hypothetical protein A2011_00370 [candidate division CPR3 bacterium GWE2_35_7]|nr:MAG: hypothetical protein A2476_04475 [candidate division CPR3 bacterium RIFOXYC2_FULL_35_7]OGB78740.1 MAG: hypothetical protein A2296_01200 [candidate division CPR3 bacterium RIFOXYB2_FULL_35_8]OGB80514.1 MAG: hypothetical protein A2011_00370 [candidate division CPR3 bacterium GWE2_35_7]
MKKYMPKLKNNKLKILILAPVIYMSPTKFGDKIYAPRDYILTLAEGLKKKGHEVILFSTPDLKTEVPLMGGDWYPLKHDLIRDRYKTRELISEYWMQSRTLVQDYYEADIIVKAIKYANENQVDIIHTDSYLVHFFQSLTEIPIIYLMHDPLPTDEAIEYWILKRFKDHKYISISNSQRRSGDLHINFIDTVYHGLPLENFIFNPKRGESLAFVGRVIKEKGLDKAIEVSKKLNIPLKLATTNDYKDSQYYQEEIAPIIDKRLVQTMGFLVGKEKIEFYNKAMALLFPISWSEPFGLVMIEAMACGTPVVAFDCGSVKEVVKDGVTGYVVDPREGITGFIEAVKKIDLIDRVKCREYFETHFTAEIMVNNYEKLYSKVLQK